MDASHSSDFTPVSDIKRIVGHLRENVTKFRPLSWRRANIQTVLRLVQEHHDELSEALKADLRVNDFFVDGVELESIFVEGKFMLKNLDEWVKPRSVSSPVLTLPAASSIVAEPFGLACIIGPWNYPVSLLLIPLMTAFAAGNTAVLKPSEVAYNTGLVLARVIPEYFEPDTVAVVMGAVDETTELLRQRFDVMFYTGNGFVGRIVMRAAAEHLTPTILELGGKCPAIIAPDANLTNACRRITWGKWSLNHGQTCVTVDYALMTADQVRPFVDQMKKTVREFYGDDLQASPDISRQINRRHTERVAALLEDDPTIEVLMGGEVDLKDNYISPTIVLAKPESKVMGDEVFGPILSIIVVDSVEASIDFINSRDKPLALYLFSSSSKLQTHVRDHTSSGGYCINDVALHLANPELPFGGVGASGMGSYHGIHGFNAFSHHKAVFQKYFSDPSLRFPPYTSSKLKWLRILRGVNLDIDKRILYALGIALFAFIYMRFFHRASL